ncbi:MAG TPA: type II toxin-antitoxin system RelE/ParE family toxin [Azospirillum sp.]
MYVLTPEAAEDFERLLAESILEWGTGTARKTRARLERQFERIADGVAVGHVREDVPARLPLRFVIEPPFVIAFDRETRIIIRILYGGQHFPQVFEG